MTNELHIRDEWRELLEANGLDTLEAFMETRAGAPLDKPGLASWRQRQRLVLSGPDGNEHTLYLKCYERPPKARGWWWPAGDRLARGRAAHEAAQMEALEAAGIPAVRWAAWGQQRDGPREVRSFVLTEAAPGEALERWLPGVYEKMSAAERSRLGPLILDALAALVRRLHNSGFVHRDLYTSHIFIEVSPAGELRLRLIDLQRVFKPRPWRIRWRVKDLAALNYSVPGRFASRTDRLRWLRKYLGVRKLGREHRRLALRIATKTAKIARHDRKRLARQAS